MNIKIGSYFFQENVGFSVTGFWLFPRVLEGLGSPGRLRGTISTYPFYLQLPVATSYGQKALLREICFTEYGTLLFFLQPYILTQVCTQHLIL